MANMAEFLKLLIRHLRQDIKKPKAWVSLILSGIIAIAEGSLEHRFYVAFNDWQDQLFGSTHMGFIKPVVFSPFLLLVLVVCWILIQAYMETKKQVVAPSVGNRQMDLSTDDPRILVEFIDERINRLYKKTALMLTNPGKTEALDVRIDDIPLRGKTIRFPNSVGTIQANNDARFDFSLIPTAGAFDSAMVIEALKKEWDSYNDLNMHELPLPMTIHYEDFSRAFKFTTKCTLVFLPYEEILHRAPENKKPAIVIRDFKHTKEPQKL
jgi:hypothetical protein